MIIDKNIKKWAIVRVKHCPPDDLELKSLISEVMQLKEQGYTIIDKTPSYFRRFKQRLNQ